MDHAQHEVPYHGTFKGYMTGFVLSILLTALPFGLVMYGSLPQTAIIVGIFLAALVQVGVHLHYFLHLDGSGEERQKVSSLLFTGLVMAIFVFGSVWIMYNLRIRMMDHMVSPTGMSSPGMTMPMPGKSLN